jgi:hypothetical protein
VSALALKLREAPELLQSARAILFGMLFLMGRLKQMEFYYVFLPILHAFFQV